MIDETDDVARIYAELLAAGVTGVKFKRGRTKYESVLTIPEHLIREVEVTPTWRDLSRTPDVP